MFRSLFRIFYPPQVTLQELLAERRNVRSWAATIWLVVTNVLVVALLTVFVLHKVTALMRASGEMSNFAPVDVLALSSSFAISMIKVLLAALLQFVLGRYVFGWIVQLGLLMVAGREYPRDPEERREKAMLLRLVHPYTRWMTVLPYLLSSVALTLIVALAPLPDLNTLTQDTAQQLVVSLFVVFIIWLTVSGVVFFCMWIYMIVVRTIAIQKIYHVSVAQAFWGPFLVYAALYFLAFLVGAIWVVISLMTGDAPQNNLNLM